MMAALKNLRYFTCLLLGVSAFNLSADAFADIKSDFETAWNKRRHVARYIRCKVEVVRVIGAESIGPGFPSEETTVDEENEYLFDTESRRLRVDVTAWVGENDKELRRHRSIAVYTPDTMARYNVATTDGPAPQGLPAIITVPKKGRSPFLDAALRDSPIAWAMGLLPVCGIEQERVDADLFRFRKVDAHTVEFTPVGDEPVMRYRVRTDQDFALTRSAYLWTNQAVRNAPQREINAVDATWELRAEGWYPATWQAEDGSCVRTSRAVLWEFLDEVPEDLWGEPEGLRKPGNILFTEKGRQKFDEDLSLIPPDAYEEPESSWGTILIILLLAALLAVAWRKRSNVQS